MWIDGIRRRIDSGERFPRCVRHQCRIAAIWKRGVKQSDSAAPKTVWREIFGGVEAICEETTWDFASCSSFVLTPLILFKCSGIFGLDGKLEIIKKKKKKKIKGRPVATLLASARRFWTGYWRVLDWARAIWMRQPSGGTIWSLMISDKR